MRAKIQDISLGKLYTRKGSIKLQDEPLAFTVDEKCTFDGSFSIVSESGMIKGIVSSPCPFITVKTMEFKGIGARIDFTFDSEGLNPGDNVKSYFVITSDVGEYIFNFEANVIKPYSQSSIGRIKTLTDFVNLCKLNWFEAVNIYRDPAFVNVFEEEDAEYLRLLYKSLAKITNISKRVEEFLIGSGVKERNLFKLESHEAVISEFVDGDSFSINVRKSDWGYADVNIKTDSPFIVLEKNVLSMDDFIGKTATINYSVWGVDSDNGNRYARITVFNAFQSEDYIIKICSTRKHIESKRSKYIKLAQLKSINIKYLEKEINKATYKDESLKIIDYLKSLDKDDKWNDMYEAYTYYMAGARDDAKKILNANGRAIKSLHSPLTAFYYYILSSIEDDDSYYPKITAISEKFPDHPIMKLFNILFDDELNRNFERKFQAIKDMIGDKSPDPYLLFLAASMVLHDPGILRSNDPMDSMLICWMGRHELINEKLSFRIQTIAQTAKKYIPNFFNLMCLCYKKYQQADMLKCICSYLIKANLYGTKYFIWYKRGIQEHLRIGGLYEAYVLSYSKSDGELPLEIVKYFSMKGSLPAIKRAMIYAYVLRNKNRLTEDYPEYIDQIREFAKQQTLKANINDDLAVIYDDFMKTEPEFWNRNKRSLEFAYKITAYGERVSHVHVLFEEEELCQRHVKLNNNIAYVYLYKKPFIILFEDANGGLQLGSTKYRANKLFGGPSIYSEVIPKENDDPMEPEMTYNERSAFELDDTIDNLCLRIDELEKDEKIKLCQQILVRMVFTEHFPENHEKIFETIYKETDAPALLTAYATLVSYKYLYEETDHISDAVCDLIRTVFIRKNTINIYCKAAYIKRFANEPEGVDSKIAIGFFKEFLYQDIFFDFFTKLPSDILNIYLLYDTSVVSFIAEPGRTLRLKIGASNISVMNEVLPGLYTTAVVAMDPAVYVILGEANEKVHEGTFEPARIREGEDNMFTKLCGINTESANLKDVIEVAKLTDVTETLFNAIKE